MQQFIRVYGHPAPPFPITNYASNASGTRLTPENKVDDHKNPSFINYQQGATLLIAKNKSINKIILHLKLHLEALQLTGKFTSTKHLYCMQHDIHLANYHRL